MQPSEQTKRNVLCILDTCPQPSYLYHSCDSQLAAQDIANVPSSTLSMLCIFVTAFSCQLVEPGSELRVAPALRVTHATSGDAHNPANHCIPEENHPVPCQLPRCSEPKHLPLGFPTWYVSHTQRKDSWTDHQIYSSLPPSLLWAQ